MSSAQDMLASLGIGGWDRFEGIDASLEATRKKLKDDARQRAQDIAAIAALPAFRPFHDALVREVLLAPHMLPLGGKYAAEQQALFAAYRQGQKDLLATLFNAIDVARGEAANMQRGETT